MFHMLSELPPLSIVRADIVVEHVNVDNFLNLFEFFLMEIQLMHHRHDNHHTHRIKIVPFNQADNDKTIPNTLKRVLYVHTHCQV